MDRSFTADVFFGFGLENDRRRPKNDNYTLILPGFGCDYITGLPTISPPRCKVGSLSWEIL